MLVPDMGESANGSGMKCVGLQSLLVYETDASSSNDEEECMGTDRSEHGIDKRNQTVGSAVHESAENKITTLTPAETESLRTHHAGNACTVDDCVSRPLSSQSEKHCSSMILPVPESVRNMFTDAVSCELKDEPEKYGGKIRSFAHEQGVWATYVYIEYLPEAEFLGFVTELISIAQRHGLSLSQNEGFHISLSKTLKLRHHWIQPFVEALKAQLTIFQRFKVMLQSVEVYVNEEKTRTFLGLKVHHGAERLEKVVKRINKCLEEFKLPSFYHDPSFHLSVAYSVGDIKEKLLHILPDLNIAFQTFVGDHPQCRTIWVSNMCCKSGNKFFNVPFKS